MLLKGAYCVGEHFVDPQSLLKMCKVEHTTCQQTRKQKRKIGWGKKLPSEKSKPYLFEIAPIHRDKNAFERPWTSPHSRWKLPVAKNCKAVVSWTIGCIAYVRWVALCRPGTMVSNKPNIQTTFPIEAVLGNKFLITKAI